MKKTLLPVLLLLVSTLSYATGTLATTRFYHILNDSVPEVNVDGKVACPGEDFEVAFSLKNFVEVEGMQFTLSWDKSIIEVDPDMRFIDVHFMTMVFNLDADKGTLEITWYGTPLSMDDGEIFLKLNFTAIGDAGDSSTFTFMDDPTPTEFTQRVNGMATRVEAVVDGGIVLVSGPTVTNAEIIDATPSEDNGSIDITVDTGTAPYTFKWSNGAETEDIENLATGEYKCTITDSRGCETVTETYTVGLISSAKEPSSLLSFSLFPNPASQSTRLQADFERPEQVQLKLTSVQGVLLAQQSFNNSRIDTEVDLSGLAVGLYFLELQTADGRMVRKLVRQ
ncbi:MAG: T9SS type A sorting domain-containing protein [Bacteroidota bacterium]